MNVTKSVALVLQNLLLFCSCWKHKRCAGQNEGVGCILDIWYSGNVHVHDVLLHTTLRLNVISHTYNTIDTQTHVNMYIMVYIVYAFTLYSIKMMCTFLIIYSTYVYIISVNICNSYLLCIYFIVFIVFNYLILEYFIFIGLIGEEKGKGKSINTIWKVLQHT